MPINVLLGKQLPEPAPSRGSSLPATSSRLGVLIGDSVFH